MAENVEVIERKRNPRKRLQVCAYARVSADSFDMLNSLSQQVMAYSSLIQSHGDWVYRGVYRDYAKTGTKENRPGFIEMLSECRKGNIDMVITKSISRFARNTLTVLHSVRELKSLGIDVYFEEQNIHTISPEGEMLLSIMASYYQEESRSMSENVRWRNKKDMEEGRLVGGADMYGYRLIDKTYVTVPEQAEVVKRIFGEYGSGEKGAYLIAKGLNEDGLRTLQGKKWSSSRVMTVLRNYTYTGNLVLQKTYVEDYLTKKKKTNHGERPQYLVEGNHEAIISTELFEKCKAIRESKRAEIEGKRKRYEHTGDFRGIIKCGLCGHSYIHKNGPYKEFWVCSTFSRKGKSECASKQIPDKELKIALCKALGMREFDKDGLLSKISSIKAMPDNVLIIATNDGREIEARWDDPKRSEGWTPEMRQMARERSLKHGKSNKDTSND